MKKVFTSIFMLALCVVMTAQSALNISGNIADVNGNGAEGVFLTLYFEDPAMDPVFMETDESGNYEFTIELGDDNTQGCFELYYIDCTFEAVVVGECYNPGNLDFTFDFVYCANGSDTCYTILYPEIQDSSIVLNVLPFGVAPFTYLWSDGTTSETLELPIDAEGEYCVEVTDSDGCVSEACIDLTPPDPCFVTIFEEYNYNSVLLFAEAYGQTDEIDYTWSTGENDRVY